jgi:TIR domain
VSGTFISYREDDAKPWALLLRDELAEAFDEKLVYLDKDVLEPGSWRVQLQEALAKCGVVLVVIGQRWLSARNSDGSRRLDDPADVHRREIATALARKGVTVIPVLVDGAAMPRSEELPDDIRALSEQQARSLADRSTHRRMDLAELISDIERATGEVATTPDYSGMKHRSRLAWLGGLVVMAFSIYIGVEIDFRHWSWIVFLILLPASVLAFLALPLRRKGVK